MKNILESVYGPCLELHPLTREAVGNYLQTKRSHEPLEAFTMQEHAFLALQETSYSAEPFSVRKRVFYETVQTFMRLHSVENYISAESIA